MGFPDLGGFLSPTPRHRARAVFVWCASCLGVCALAWPRHCRNCTGETETRRDEFCVC